MEGRKRSGIEWEGLERLIWRDENNYFRFVMGAGLARKKAKAGL